MFVFSLQEDKGLSTEWLSFRVITPGNVYPLLRGVSSVHLEVLSTVEGGIPSHTVEGVYYYGVCHQHCGGNAQNVYGFPQQY